MRVVYSGLVSPLVTVPRRKRVLLQGAVGFDASLFLLAADGSLAECAEDGVHSGLVAGARDGQPWLNVRAMKGSGVVELARAGCGGWL